MEEEMLFNTALLDELGNSKSLIMIMNYFLSITPKDIQELQQSVAEQDFQSIHQKAHKLKGAVAMLKAQTMAELLFQLESAADIERDMTRIEDLVAKFVKMYAVLEVQMKAAIAQLQLGLDQ